jgi:hypothetical protein
MWLMATLWLPKREGGLRYCVLLSLETYQAAENSTYLDNIDTLSPSSRAPACKGSDSHSWGANHPCFDNQIISAMFENPVIAISSGKV